MLAELHIKNMFLIEEVHITFDKGLNILSGETGAGKSIVIDALNFLLGAKSDKSYVRTGAETALVEGLITSENKTIHNRLNEMGIEYEDGILISRTVSANGKGTCRVNGHTVTASMLREITAVLFDIQGQHDHQTLLNPSRHLELLDRLCSEELSVVKAKLNDVVRRYREVSKAYTTLVEDEKQLAGKLSVYRFQSEEIKNAALKVGEEEMLTEKSKNLGGISKISDAALSAIALITGDEDGMSAYDRISKAKRLIAEASEYDKSLKTLADNLNDAILQIDDALHGLSHFADALSDPDELDKVEARLEFIQSIKKKYGMDVAGVLSYYEQINTEIDSIQNSETEKSRLLKDKKLLEDELLSLCQKASALRLEGAKSVKERIEDTLKFLGMKNVSFEISIEKKSGVGSTGFDKVEFLISPNLGEPLKPLAKIASGGEMSRVSLAMKSVMAHVDDIETFVFDEIDTGVSGQTARKVGERLAALGKTHQLIVITHLPQIAALSEKHFFIEKHMNDNKTTSTVTELDENGVIGELVRLMGSETTEASLKAAEELRRKV